MKKFFIRIAKRIVVWYATRKFMKAVRVAESWYKYEHKRYYVIDNPENKDELVAISAQTHFAIRKQLGISSKDLPLKELKAHCWYYTKSETGRDQMPAKEFILRKQAYCYQYLLKAKLVKQPEEE